MSAQHANGNRIHLPHGSPPAARTVEKKQVPLDKLILGTAALASWILLFSTGLLIESVEYRLMLSPRSVSKQLGSAELLTVPGEQAAHVREEADKRRAGAAAELKTGTATASAPDSQDRAAENPAAKAKPSFLASLHAFAASMFCFTPINLAILTLVAGLLGGCSSNIAIETMPDHQRAELHELHPRRHWYLQEPPVSAAIRGFVVYLCIIGGLYVAMDDPFKDPTPAQYIRLAGLLSILAFMVGYDSSRLEDWISIIPAPGQARSQPTKADSEQPPAKVEAGKEAKPPIPATLEEAEAKALAAEAGDGAAK